METAGTALKHPNVQVGRVWLLLQPVALLQSEEEDLDPEQIGVRLEMLWQEALRGEEGQSSGRLRAVDGCSRSENRNITPSEALGENRWKK